MLVALDSFSNKIIPRFSWNPGFHIKIKIMHKANHMNAHRVVTPSRNRNLGGKMWKNKKQKQDQFMLHDSQTKHAWPHFQNWHTEHLYKDQTNLKFTKIIPSKYRILQSISNIFEIIFLGTNIMVRIYNISFPNCSEIEFTEFGKTFLQSFQFPKHSLVNKTQRAQKLLKASIFNFKM